MVIMNRKIKALLDRRTDQIFADNEDLLVDMYSAPLWMQRQMYLRAKLMAIEEGYDGLCWPEQGRVGEYAGLACQGWLLVEDEQIIGGTEFAEIQYFDPKTGLIRLWSWVFVYVDPEHRGKGNVIKRLPKWRERYGDFLVEQPNEATKAMLIKVGYSELLERAIKLQGPGLNFIPRLDSSNDTNS
jgi:hypothetical protein